MGPNRPGRGSHVGTASFMVSADARGRGVGRRLAEYVVQWHRDQGFRAIQFNAVVETNEAAVRLWQALGFRIIGTVPEAFDSAAHGLRRPARDAPAAGLTAPAGWPATSQVAAGVTDTATGVRRWWPRPVRACWSPPSRCSRSG